MQLGSFNIQQVTAVPAVIGNEIKVVPADTEGVGETWRPQTDQGPVDIREAELARGLGRVDLHRSCADTAEVSVQSDRVEDISPETIPIAALLEILEARQRPAIDMELGRKASHHRERCAGVGRGFQHPSVALDLKGSALKHHHLTVQI